MMTFYLLDSKMLLSVYYLLDTVPCILSLPYLIFTVQSLVPFSNEVTKSQDEHMDLRDCAVQRLYFIKKEMSWMSCLLLELAGDYSCPLSQLGLGRFRPWESGSQYLDTDLGTHRLNILEEVMLPL